MEKYSLTVSFCQRRHWKGRWTGNVQLCSFGVTYGLYLNLTTHIIIIKSHQDDAMEDNWG